MNKIKFYICISIALIFTSLSKAFFDDIGMGARQTAMGCAFTAVSDDVYSIYYNPAGLAKIETKNISFTYAQLWPSIGGEGLSDMFVGFNTMLRNIPFGFSWQSRVLQNMITADTFSLAFAKQIKNNLYVGITSKYLKFELTAEEVNSIPELKNNKSKSAVGFDIGILLKTKKLDIGLSLKDVNSPDIGIFESSPLPIIVKFGVAKLIDERLLVVADVSNSNNLTEFSLGGEFYAIPKIKLRGGVLSSTADYSRFSVGAGFVLNKFIIDYSYVVQLFSNGETDTGVHRVSLNLILK